MDIQMKIVALISRNLLGLLFLVFGLNGILHFIPMPPPSGRVPSLPPQLKTFVQRWLDESYPRGCDSAALR